jgi:osomolarity two-component system phosphorelay intermediate protein YPD1
MYTANLMISTILSSRRDLQQLILLCRYLKKSASVLGMYRVRECCENIQRYGAMMRKTGLGLETVEGLSFCCVGDEISSLRDSLCFARRAIDEFYETETIVVSD